MKTPSDSAYANMLLKKRQAKSSLRHCYKKTLKLNVMSICVCLFGTAFLVMFDIGIFFYAIFIGVFIGAFARDLGWFISIKKTWSFTEKVIDWQKVEELADMNDDV